MAVDLSLPGRPEDVHGVAAWLRGSLVTGVDGAATHLIAARQHAESGWADATGAAFRARVGRGVEGAERLGSATAQAARTLDGFAVSLAHTQAELREIDRWDGLVAAYRRADEAAAAVERHWQQVDRTALRNALTDLRTKWFLSAGDMVGGGAGTVVAYQVHALGTEANRLRDAADVAPTGHDRTRLHALPRPRRGPAPRCPCRRHRAAGTRDRPRGRRVGAARGWVLAAAGVVYDIATGKPTDQAIVSGAIGFGASVAAGAAIGTLIPVPVLGTALGAVGGAARRSAI